MGESFSSGPEVALRCWRQARWPGAAAGALEEAALRRKPLSLGGGKLKRRTQRFSLTSGLGLPVGTPVG